MLRIKVDSSKCSGCKICMLSCCFHHEGRACLKTARMRVEIHRNEASRIEPERIDLPVICRQCEDSPCAEVCPAGAFIFEGRLGIHLLDEELCTGCGICIDECPHGVLIMHPERNVPVKCDLCGGEPQCAGHCPAKALTTTQ